MLAVKCLVILANFFALEINHFGGVIYKLIRLIFFKIPKRNSGKKARNKGDVLFFVKSTSSDLRELRF